jgi:2-isopropylmalate synthase
MIPFLMTRLLGGQLVVCAFSGSHQDAIKKGFAARTQAKAKHEDRWELPYLPIDPVDIGRTYEAVIRVNSQSGKGGAAWIILRHLNLDLPRGLQVAFSKIVQKEADALSRELKPTEIIRLFEDTYFQSSIELLDYDISADRSASPAPGPGQKTQSSKNLKRMFKGVVSVAGQEHHLTGVGNGAISSLTNALYKGLGIMLDVTDYKEHAIGEGKEVKAATYIECTASDKKEKVWGIAVHQDVVQASLMALLGAASSLAK